MDVDANSVIDKLCNQIKEMSRAIAVKDVQIELLYQKISELSANK